MPKQILLITFIFLSNMSFAQVENLSLTPPVVMPNGAEFKTWNNTTDYTKTYIVDQNHPLASDQNPGTADKPFKTINRAAQVVKAGERVLIKSGVYRKKVIPKQGGEGPDKMISYEATVGEQVIIKGSCIVKSNWVRSLNPGHYSEKLWMTTLPDSIFPETSPFKIQNASAEDIEIMSWAAEWSGRIPYTLPRGLVFQNGNRLVQLAVYEDLVRVPGSFWVDSTGTVIHIHPYNMQNPNEVIMEVTVQQHLFKPDVPDLGYIQVKGITFMHAGNGFPRTGVGALFTMGGHHWIIEDNRFEGINSVAIEIGALFEETADRSRMRRQWGRGFTHPGYTIVRNNVVSDCGTGGIQGLVNKNVLVENNHLYNIGWQDVERYWECGAIKLLVCHTTLVRRNLIHDVQAGSAIWLDWNNKNCRITQNTVFDMDMCCNGALFIEASRVLNIIDHNILWDIRGVPVYCGDSDSLLIAHNLFGPCTGPGILAKVGTDRVMDGRPFTSRHHRIVRNIFLTDNPMELEDPDNTSNDNIFTVDFDLSNWQKQEYDSESLQLKLNLSFDREQVQLRIESEKILHYLKNDLYFDFDFLNLPRGEKTIAGPFHDQFKKPVNLKVDPRR